jgi:outer membrane protein assembly factor BamD (BamD/ComL family)
VPGLGSGVEGVAGPIEGAGLAFLTWVRWFNTFRRMTKRPVCLLMLLLVALVVFPHVSPAPLIYRPGEGWVYEAVGQEGKWIRGRAKDQLQVAQEAFEEKDYKAAMRAAKRTVKQWPLSDYAPDAQYIMGRSYEERHSDEKAFKEYQKLIEKYPKYAKYDEVLKRQYEIANRYLGGQWFKLWGIVPLYPSMDKTAEMYQKLIKNGPYSEVAAQAQMDIGTAREKQEDFGEAVKAYEKAADRYNDRPVVAADALYKAGLAHQKQAKTAEYDQSAAASAIAVLTDFMALYPDDPRVPDAQKIIEELRTEQARGSFKVAKFYEKAKRYAGALVYYNEVVLRDPNSEYAAEAKERIEVLKARLEAKKEN